VASEAALRELFTPEYKRQADSAIELQLEKAGVTLAYLLNKNLR
jgi:hypothetical protein